MNNAGKLKRMQEAVAQKRSLEAKLEELRLQQHDLENRAAELEKVMQREQADVDRMERTSLASVFYAVIGQREEKLDQEKLEAYAAKMKYDSAVQELTFAQADIRRMESRLQEMAGCEQEYEELLKQKTAAVKASGSADATRYMQLDGQITALNCEKKELAEALAAGSQALETAKSILESLNSAESWGTWDLVGGGLFSDLAKHGHLDDAQNKVQQLQSDLRRFKTELADVTIQAEMQVKIEGFLRVADYVFDGFFADWAVLDKINQSQANVEKTCGQIEQVLSRLRSMAEADDRKIEELKAQQAALIVAAEL